MDAKEILNRVKDIKKEIAIKKQLARTYRDVASGLQSPQYSDMPKNTNCQLQPMADAINNAIEIEEDIRLLEKEMFEIKEKIYQIIQLIDIKEHQLILLERYINEKSWSRIGRTIGYANSRMYEKHQHALMDFSAAFEKFGVNRSSSE